jgi:hypothetical protein
MNHVSRRDGRLVIPTTQLSPRWQLAKGGPIGN